MGSGTNDSGPRDRSTAQRKATPISDAAKVAQVSMGWAPSMAPEVWTRIQADAVTVASVRRIRPCFLGPS
jgi:hypothetical protein